MSNSFLVRVLSLLITIVIIHSIYLTLVRPNASQSLNQSATVTIQENKQTFWVVIKDYEQEICFILFFWALIMIYFKLLEINSNLRLLDKRILPIDDGEVILPDDCLYLIRSLNNSNLNSKLLPRIIIAALQIFNKEKSINAVNNIITQECEAESNRIDTDMSLLRYISWAIPSIGFIGTVRGIGLALENAHLAIAGDISAVTEKLGIAFNSTFIALLLSIVLMFCINQLTNRQETCIHDAMRYCQKYIVEHLQLR